MSELKINGSNTLVKTSPFSFHNQILFTLNQANQ